MFARRGHGTGRCRPCAGTVEVARHVATRASRPRCTQASAGPHAACSRVPLAPLFEHFIGPDMRHVHARDLRPEGKLHCGIVQCGGIGWSDHVAGSGAPHQMKRIRACACDSWRRMGSWTCDRGLANPRGSNGRPKTCSRWRPRTPPATRVWGYLIPLCTGGWGRGALSILTVASAMHTPQSSRALIMGCASAKNMSP